MILAKRFAGAGGRYEHRCGTDIHARRPAGDARPEEVVFTSGATESDNLAILGLADHGTHAGRRHIISTQIEHKAVLEPLEEMARRGFEVTLLPPTAGGWIDPDAVRQALRSDTLLVSVMAANNETGVIQPWREILSICQSYEVPFFTDAVQWLGKMPAKDLGHCDFVSGAAHKFGGPRGIGFLKITHKSKITPLLVGGKQEQGVRAGTENVATILSMLAALEIREKQIANSQHLLRGVWRENFEKQLLKELPGVKIVGANSQRLWNTVSALMPDGVQSRWLSKLDRAGFAVSTGSACTTGKEEPSHILAAMHFKPAEAHRVLRFSSGWETTEADWDALAKALAKIHGETHHVKA